MEMKPAPKPLRSAWLPLALLLLSSAMIGAEDRNLPVPIASSPYAENPHLPRSVVVLPAELVVRLEPRGNSRRRGVVVKDSRLPVLELALGPGCTSAWYRVFERAWVCGDHAVPSDAPPTGVRLPVMGQGDLSPWPYAFVRAESIEYRPAGGVLHEVRELRPGFGFGVGDRVEIDGRRFVRTVGGRLVPAGAVGISGKVSEFQGVPLYQGRPWPVGWVNSKTAGAYKEPSRHKRNLIGQARRYDMFEVLEEKGTGRNRFFRFDENAWLWSGDVRVSRSAKRPDGVDEDERWIDVDLETQIVTAYEGDAPVYATLVSTGRAGKARTPRGRFPIWVKIAATSMDNTEEELEESDLDPDSADAGPAPERYIYSLQDVPWTQFFHEGYGLHGVYWHDRFGNRRSQGCVNLALRDARWFFDWSLPRLPDGWWAMHTVPEDRPTVVRVR